MLRKLFIIWVFDLTSDEELSEFCDQNNDEAKEEGTTNEEAL